MYSNTGIRTRSRIHPTAAIRGEFLLAIGGRSPEGSGPAIDGSLSEDRVPEPDDSLHESPAQIEDHEHHHQLEGPGRLLVFLINRPAHLFDLW